MVLKTLNLEGQSVDPEALKGDPHHLAPLLRGIIRYAKPERILDPTGGSGMTRTVAEEALVPATVTDLNAPTDGVDLFTIDEEVSYDLVFFHPDMWMARPDAVHPHDLGGTMTWDAYVDLVTDAVEHLATLLRPGGHLVVVCPITRRKNVVRDLSRDLVCLLGAPTQPPLVHAHPECRSRGSMYGRKFIPIAHDNVLVWTREELLGGPETDTDVA